jgi:hypothetical protein
MSGLNLAGLATVSEGSMSGLNFGGLAVVGYPSSTRRSESRPEGCEEAGGTGEVVGSNRDPHGSRDAVS